MKTQLIEAIETGQEERVVELLKARPALAGSCDENGVSLIFIALYRKHERIAHLLAEKVQGLSIHEAVSLGECKQLNLLLEQEPSLANTPSADGFFPLHLAAFFRQPHALEALLDGGANANAITQNSMKLKPLNSAVSGGSLVCVQHLLKGGSDANSTQAGGVNALMSAAGTGAESILDLLLEKGAHKNTRCHKGKKAADYARQHGHETLVQRLL